ncbi:hypothetical protein [Roseovarius indicus]|uniref:Uncharacterized protein n=1 Tax=Roseovarius indicus TaxID=540747 RepID=A0A5P3AGD9_9RHOB|nr:hypothetical protein [Roseovarius indicus]QEW27846.1 hypothetical protein RIdsm_03667 [Roseovarius indicus]SFE79342.1 hypothetical protein SAMN04488031_12220 [Roseovarius indicus]
MIFKHTSSEPGLWRGWLKNGQSVEISTSKHGWDFGGGVHVHSNDEDRGDRMLFLKFWRLTVVLPLGVIDHPWPAMDGPQWSAYASKEFGLTFHWGLRRKSFDWPWDWHTLAYEMQLPKHEKQIGPDDEGAWVDVFNREAEPYKEHHPYTYTLKNGTVQERVATVSKRRHVLTWRAFKSLGWPFWIKESIDVEFDGEVGERTGSWKGGTIGCGYDLRPGETMLDALRRMEGERIFR